MANVANVFDNTMFVNNLNFKRSPTTGQEQTVEFLGTLSPLTMDSIEPYLYSRDSYGMQDIAASPEPYLQILEEPVDKFRFRYKSEMVGTHGSLSGMNSDRSRKNTYPTVKLCNYEGDAIIRCALYQIKTNEPLLHAHRLVIKYGSEERDDPHDYPVTKENKHTAVFQGMGIIHTARKYLIDELVKKKRRYLKSSGIHINQNQMLEIQHQSEIESKSMTLNSVCLGFQAYCVNPHSKTYRALGDPVYSHAINNLKSALTGDLKIVRMDHSTASCAGGQEIFLLVEKVTKNNIKVKFFQMNECDEVEWSAYGNFSHIDVHHQYAIVLRTPPYKDQDIQEPVEIMIQLERPSDGELSEPRAFKFKPCEKIGRKRARYSETLSSSELPATINPSLGSTSGSLDLDQEFFSDFTNIRSGEFEALIKDVMPDFAQYSKRDMLPSFELAKDSPISAGKCNKDPHVEMLAKKFVSDLETLIKTKPTAECVESFIKQGFLNVDSDGNSVLHTSIICQQFNHVQYLLILLSKLKHLKLTDITNNADETALHISVRENVSQVTDLLLSVGADCNALNLNGDTALHLVLLEKLNMKNFKKLVSATDLSIGNYAGYSALHLAVINDDLDAVKILVNANCDINQRCSLNGFTALHFAVDKTLPKILSYLLYDTDASIVIMDYKDYRPLDLVQMKMDQNDLKSLEIHQIFTDYVKAKGSEYVMIKTEIKEEESDSDMEVTEVHVKSEPSSPINLESEGDTFSAKCMDNLSTILDNTDELQHLSKTLKFNTTSTKTLFNYINLCNITKSTVVDILKECNAEEALDVIYNMSST